MQPLIGHLREPATDVRVGCRHIEAQASLLEGRGQRDTKTALQVSVEAFDLALGLGAIRLAHTRGEAELLGDGQQPVVPAMLAGAVGIALGDDGARVVEQHVLGYAAEVDEGLTQTSEPSVGALIGGEPHPARTAVSQRGDKGHQGITAAPDVGEVGLHLLARRRLETNDRFRLLVLVAAKKLLELRYTTGVAQFLNLPQQHGCWNPVRPGRLDAPVQIVLVRIQLGGPCLAGLVLLGISLTQIPPDRVA